MVTFPRAVVAAFLVGFAACSGPHSADEAFLAVEKAVAAGDAAALYGVVDRDTRWAVEAAYKDEKNMRTIITARYPEAEQAAALVRLAAAAEPDAEHYFAVALKDHGTFALLRRRLGAASGPIVHSPPGADATDVAVARQDGLAFHVRKTGRTWVCTDLAAEWTATRDRAVHTLKTVRDNAELYQKSGATGGE